MKSKEVEANDHPGTTLHGLSSPGIAWYMLLLMQVKGQAMVLGLKFL